MKSAAEVELVGIVKRILTRYCRQQRQVPPDDGRLESVAVALAGLVGERGLPPPRDTGATTARGGPGEAEVATLAARLAGEGAGPVLGEAAKQLVKACFYPPLADCRDSFREVAGDGVCRRQQLERARGRISGSHCVDCPHWIGRTAEGHAAYFAAEWRMDPAVRAAHPEVFLPEDFRALRRWLQAAAGPGGIR